MTLDEINILGNIIDTTWGRSSTSAASNFSCKAKLIKDGILITFGTFATFASERDIHNQLKSLESDADKIILAWIEKIKREFKTEAGHSLKIKIKNMDSTTETTNTQPHVSDRKTILFRRTFTCSLE